MNLKQKKRQKGKLGEDIACKFLVRNGFRILARNYAKKWGELDVIGTKNGDLNFFEVKSISGTVKDAVRDGRKPEDNVNTFKARQISRMIQTYLAESGGGVESKFQFHVLSVYMNMTTHRAHVKWLKDIIL